MMSINPDAHSTREIDLTHWGVEMARKGGVPKERVLNCLNREEFAEYLANRRNARREAAFLGHGLYRQSKESFLGE
jgi:DNA polymerase (family X)